jgi:hypothetical protein
MSELKEEVDEGSPTHQEISTPPIVVRTPRFRLKTIQQRQQKFVSLHDEYWVISEAICLGEWEEGFASSSEAHPGALKCWESINIHPPCGGISSL